MSCLVVNLYLYSGQTASLISYLNVHSPLSKALLGIRLQFHPPPSAQVEKIDKEMVSLLSAKQGVHMERIGGE